MIIRDLIDYCHVLQDKGKAPAYGWVEDNVPYALNISSDGELDNVVTLGDVKAKKTRHMVTVPASEGRSSGIKARFGCDNASYLLGDPSKGKTEQARKRFEASSELHKEVLSNVDTPVARAILAFFEHGPQWHKAAEQFDDEWKNVALSNFTFMVDGDLAVRDDSIVDAWNAYFDRAEDADAAKKESLVSGDLIVPEKTHPKVKGVMGAQSSGASLISFNGDAFSSYGLEQCDNAPLSKREANDYITGMNTLLADRDRVNHMDNVTVISWAESGQPEYGDVVSVDVFGNVKSVADTVDKGKPVLSERGRELLAVMESATKALSQGRSFDYDGIELSPHEHFHVLGLAPNAARVSVSFYLTDSFGAFAQNIERHNADCEIIRPKFDATTRIPLYRILRQTVNANSKSAAASPALSAALIKSVLRGTPYPAALLNNVEIRIRADRDINADRAAIIKAYYLRFSRFHPIIENDEEADRKFKEVLQVDINEDSDYTPYVLGRMFSVYEQIQKAANPKINTTIKDKYFNSAAATPSRIFGVLGKLAAKHLRKASMNQGARVNLTKKLEALSVRIGQRYPDRLTLAEQGAFQLGYYFEDQSQYKNNK